MNRAPLGAGLIILAVLGLMVATSVSGRDVAGDAVAVPPDPVPAVGACIAMDGQGDSTEVPCSAEHTGEVVLSWRSGEQPTSAGAPPAFDTPCWSAAPPPSTGKGWQPPPVPTRIVQRRPDSPLGWGACLAEPIGYGPGADAAPLRYTGSVLSAASVADYPAGLRACYRSGSPGSDTTSAGQLARAVPCNRPHDAELLAVPGSAPDDRSCAELAGELVGDRAFTGRHALTAGAVPVEPAGTVRISFDDDADRGGAVLIQLDGAGDNCAVLAAPGMSLIGSVVGLGDAPIPYR